LNDASCYELVHLSGRRSAKTIRACGCVAAHQGRIHDCKRWVVSIDRFSLQSWGGPYTSFCSSSNAPTKRTTAASLGKMPTTSLRRLISPVSRSSGLVLCILVRCCAGNPVVDENVGLSVVHQCGKHADARPGLIGDLPPLLAGGLGIVLGEGGADPGRDVEGSPFMGATHDWLVPSSHQLFTSL
jgi:hypothetical protein